MKKLLIATIAAVSVGLCAKAEGTGFTENGTSFEGADEAGENGQLVVEAQSGYWEKDEKVTGEDLFTVTAADEGLANVSRPDKWANSENKKVLAIDTSAPLIRNVNAMEPVGGKLVFPAQDVSTKAVFFDSVVQFTATDVRPQVDVATNKDKLSVWLYASPENLEDGAFDEDVAKSHLVITAGRLDGATLVQEDYLTDVEITPETWHRLTIKSFIGESGRLMFNVFIDGDSDPISVKGVKDFMSLVEVNDATEDIKLQGVAFNGKGAVDDIVFTTEDPFYVPPAVVEKANVTVKFNDLSGITADGIYFYVNGQEYDTIDALTSNYELDVESSVSVQFMLQEGYELVAPNVQPNGDGAYEVSIDKLKAEGETIEIEIKLVESGDSAWTDNEKFAIDLTTNVDGLLANVYNKVTGEPTTEQASYLMTTVGTASGEVTVKVGGATKAPADTFELSVGNNVKIEVPYYEVTEGVVKVATAIIALETVEITVGDESKTIAPAISGVLSVTGITSEKNVVGELFNNVATVKVRDTTDPIKLAFNDSTDVFFTKKVYTKADASKTVAYGMTGLDDNAFWFYFQYGQDLDDLRSDWNGGSVNYKIGCYNKGIANVVMSITIDQQFTVEFKNGDTVVQSTPVWNGEYATAPSSNPEAPTGQQFVGWFNGDAKFDATVPVTANVNYTAKFEDMATYPSVGGVTTPEYSVNAKDAIDAAFPNNNYPAGGLTIEVNGQELSGTDAVAMLNEAVEMFTLADDAKFFNEDGVMEISFKATSADPETIAYEATVGKATATVNDTSYEVVPKYIDIATNKELSDKPAEGSVTFRLVIQKKK